LRKGVWAKTKGKSKAFYTKHVKKLHELRRFASSGDKTKKKKKGSKKNKGTRKSK